MTGVLLFGTKNNLSTQDNSVRIVMFAPTGDHSQKPEAVYELIESKSPGPYLEMFARSKRGGWTAYGDEVDTT
jgi:N6-adenosine-specific RNA methylase IME4